MEFCREIMEDEAISKLNLAYELISEARELFFEVASSEPDEKYSEATLSEIHKKGIRLGKVLDELFKEC